MLGGLLLCVCFGCVCVLLLFNVCVLCVNVLSGVVWFACLNVCLCLCVVVAQRVCALCVVFGAMLYVVLVLLLCCACLCLLLFCVLLCVLCLSVCACFVCVLSCGCV